MQNPQEKASIRSRVDETANFWAEHNFSLNHIYASLAGILQLDDYYHLEGIEEMLRNLQLMVVKSKKPDKADYVKLLGDLADEFRWQTYHGIRLYEPL